MSNQRYPEGYMVVVHSRAMAYPLRGWYERRQSTTLRHPTLEQGAGSTSPPRCAGGWVRHGSVQSIVHVSAPRANMCTPVCSRLKLHASVRPVGADQRT